MPGVAAGMISAAESSSVAMAAPSTFSYAQAAKGQSVPSSNPPVQGQGSRSLSTTSSAEIAVDLLEMARNAESRHSQAEKVDVDSNIGSESDLRSEVTTERRSEPKQDDDAGRLDQSWRHADMEARSSSATARSADEPELWKPRKSKRTKASDALANEQASDADKDLEELVQDAPKIELSEAPIPSFNIWQQRKEAQLARVKPSMKIDEDMAIGVPCQMEDAKKVAKPEQDAFPPARGSVPINGAKPPRKTGDPARPERSGSRGSRVVSKEAKEGKTVLPPSVEDAASWPTPETALKEDRKKPATGQDKDPKEGQDDGSQAKSRQKGKWVAYDYVPSVNFETQLPQMRNSKARGGARAANHARAATGVNSSDKATSSASASKPNEPRDRPREASTASNRATSPPPAKRGSVDASNIKEQKKALGYTAGDKGKEVASSHQTEQVHGARDRPEGRGERGRGYRGRGGHHSISSHSQNQPSTGFASGSSTSRQLGPYSPPPRQGGHNQMFIPPPQRGGRGRNGASASFHRMSLPNGASRPLPVQAQFAAYEFSAAPLPGVPYQSHQPYWDSVVMSLLRNQIEYYFSIENLCKDMYLRKRMNSQGFVHLHFVAAFKRIRELTSDMAMIRAVCESSSELELVVGEDDVEQLRRRSGWQSFVLPMEERDDVARNSGPPQVTPKSRAYTLGSQFNGAGAPPYGAPPPLGYNPQGDASLHQFPDGHGVNETVNGSGVGHGGASQLSAEVPDFSPSGPAAAVSFGQDGIDRPTGVDAKTTAAAQMTPSLDGHVRHGDESAANARRSGIDARSLDHHAVRL